MESILGAAAVCRRVGEWAGDVQHLDDRPRPAMRDDERQRVLVRRPDVDKVDVEAVNFGNELREGVQPGLDPPEIVVGDPVARECLHGRQLHALRLIHHGLFLRPSRRCQAAPEILD
jgi:hypothetical protein